jgi:vacuolar-type H+-ATPase subunit E/Vma4
MRYAIVRADKTHEIVDSGDTPPNYKTFQELVAAPSEDGKATYQAINGPKVSIYLNENGKYLSDLEINVAVTIYARHNRLIFPTDYILGDCVIVGEPDDEGEETAVDENVLREILASA